MQDIGLGHECLNNVFEDREGNLIFSGSGLINSKGWGGRAFLSRFSSGGIPDINFGKNGFYCFDFEDSYRPVFQIGDIYITAGNDNYDSHKLISVNNDGSTGNYVYTCEIDFFQDMQLQGNNKIILGGGHVIDNNKHTNFALERVVIDSETSIKLNEYSKEVIIFPNPTKENLHFSKETAYEIFDIQGKILLKSIVPVKSVSIANLKTGIYFVRINNNVQKFVKE